MKPSSETARRSTLLRALRQPPLFAALLDRYQRQGRVPSQLAGVLWRDYGITRKASSLAAETFCKSARYAGVLDRDGAFLPSFTEPPQAPTQTDVRQKHPATLTDLTPGAKPTAGRADADQSDRGSASEQRFEFALTDGKVARLALPLKLCRKDLEIVQRQIDFLEYQVIEEEST